MIFSGNTTALGATSIPMAEGYDCSCGVSLALVESARNDLAMFNALIQADYKEMSICSESTGVMQEGEIAALHEAVGGGIFKKIAELFRKLVAKIKSIFHNFIARIRGLISKDADLVKKYQKELGLRGTKLNNKLEVKWRKARGNHSSVTFNVIPDDFDENAAVTNHKDDAWDRAKTFIANDDLKRTDNTSEYIKEYINSALEEEDTVKLGEVGGWDGVCDFISNYRKKVDEMESNMRKSEGILTKIVEKYDKKAKAMATAVVNKTEIDRGPEDQDADGHTTGGKSAAVQKDVDNAVKQYEMAQAYQTIVLANINATQQIATIEYKQNKAAFMKAVTVSDKKLEESMIFAEAVAEAAENEVEDVINGALSNEELSDLCSATSNVKDGDVSDDPDKLTYYKDNNFTSNASFSTSQGAIDSCVGGGKVEEAYFGQLFY